MLLDKKEKVQVIKIITFSNWGISGPVLERKKKENNKMEKKNLMFILGL